MVDALGWIDPKAMRDRRDLGRIPPECRGASRGIQGIHRCLRFANPAYRIEGGSADDCPLPEREDLEPASKNKMDEIPRSLDELIAEIRDFVEQSKSRSLA